MFIKRTISKPKGKDRNINLRHFVYERTTGSNQGAYPGLFWGRCRIRTKMGWGGYPRKFITFEPFANGILVILVKIVDFVIFFLLFLDFFKLAFLGRVCRTPLHTAPPTPAYAPSAWTKLGHIFNCNYNVALLSIWLHLSTNNLYLFTDCVICIITS